MLFNGNFGCHSNIVEDTETHAKAGFSVVTRGPVRM